MQQWRHYVRYWRWDWPKIAVLGAICLLGLMVLLWPGKQPQEPQPPQLPTMPEQYGLPAGGPLIAVLMADGSVQQQELEPFLVGVVAAEMPATFAPAALQAQAIAARTYIVSHTQPYGQPRHEQADICCDSTHCQAYAGLAELEQRWGAEFAVKYEAVCHAVSASKGLVICYAGQPVETPYCSTCGGSTEAAADVWGADLPYLQSVPCYWDSHAPRYAAKQVFSLQQAADLLQVKPGALGAMTAQYTAGGAVAMLQLEGKQLSGAELRERLGLNSAQIGWLVQDERILFSTLGFGHGVGLCQYGADGMAQAGYTAEEILRHYYQGVEVVAQY